MTSLSTAQPIASSEALVERLFQRFGAIYGRHWLDMWAGIPMPQVMATWADGLAHLPAKQIADGLSRLGKFPPTLTEFRELCRVEPAHRAPDLPVIEPPREEIPEHAQAMIDQVLAKSRAAMAELPKRWDTPACTCLMRGKCEVCVGYAEMRARTKRIQQRLLTKS